jgi:hypothetical protein
MRLVLKAFGDLPALGRGGLSITNVLLHILAHIGNKPSGGGDISIEDMSFRIHSIDDPEEYSVAGFRLGAATQRLLISTRTPNITADQ